MNGAGRGAHIHLAGLVFAANVKKHELCSLSKFLKISKLAGLSGFGF
jgi:hypothetical protein